MAAPGFGGFIPTPTVRAKFRIVHVDRAHDRRDLGSRVGALIIAEGESISTIRKPDSFLGAEEPGVDELRLVAACDCGSDPCDNRVENVVEDRLLLYLSAGNLERVIAAGNLAHRGVT